MSVLRKKVEAISFFPDKYPILFMLLDEAEVFVARGLAPRRHVFFYAVVIRFDFEHLARLQLLDPVCRFINRHRARKAHAVQYLIGFDVFYVHFFSCTTEDAKIAEKIKIVASGFIPDEKVDADKRHRHSASSAVKYTGLFHLMLMP